MSDFDDEDVKKDDELDVAAIGDGDDDGAPDVTSFEEPDTI